MPKRPLIICHLSLIIILAALTFEAQAVKKITANPINVAYVLAHQTDTAKMASILTYYGYVPSSTEESRVKSQDSSAVRSRSVEGETSTPDSSRSADSSQSSHSSPFTLNSSRSADSSPTVATYINATDGSTIRYTFQDATAAQPYPEVEVKSKTSAKDEAAILKDLEFKRDGNGYARIKNQYARTAFTCRHRPNGYLLFHQLRLPKEDSVLPTPSLTE